MMPDCKVQGVSRNCCKAVWTGQRPRPANLAGLVVEVLGRGGGEGDQGTAATTQPPPSPALRHLIPAAADLARPACHNSRA